MTPLDAMPESNAGGRNRSVVGFNPEPLRSEGKGMQRSELRSATRSTCRELPPLYREFGALIRPGDAPLTASMESQEMRAFATCASGLLVSATLVLSGCGGGGSDVSPPDFDIGALVNGHPVAGVDVFPGDEQTLYAVAGQAFELDSSGPVEWTVVVGGSTIAGSGNTIIYGGATVQELLTTTSQFAASTSAGSPLLAPVPITLYATSLDDSSQVAKIDVVITN